MNITATLRRRVAETGSMDPDSLHGLLLVREARWRPDSEIAGMIGVTPYEFETMCGRAAAGGRERVASANGTNETLDPGLPGLFPRAWMREIIAMMLRPDGVTSAQINDAMFDKASTMGGPATMVSRVRAECRVFHVEIEAERGEGNSFRWRIAGNHAWRMQRIIANGWAL